MTEQKTAECGTNGGYTRHLRRGETTCGLCREAHAVYNDQNRTQHPWVKSQGYRNELARSRALRKLARMHPQEFKILYEWEKAAAREAAS